MAEENCLAILYKQEIIVIEDQNEENINISKGGHHLKKIRKYVFCPKGGGGGQPPNPNFFNVFLVKVK